MIENLMQYLSSVLLIFFLWMCSILKPRLWRCTTHQTTRQLLIYTTYSPIKLIFISMRRDHRSEDIIFLNAREQIFKKYIFQHLTIKFGIAYLVNCAWCQNPTSKILPQRLLKYDDYIYVLKTVVNFDSSLKFVM